MMISDINLIKKKDNQFLPVFCEVLSLENIKQLWCLLLDESRSNVSQQHAFLVQD